MSATDFRRRLLARERLHGTLLSLANADLSDVVASRGFDWLFLDTEHGAFDAHAIRAHLRAVGDRAATLVRVPALDRAAIAQALDAGAHGVIIPQVNSAAEAAEAVAAGRYPPAGRRGLGASRAQGFGLDGGGYLARANFDITIVVQAETTGAVEAIDRIARTAGVDAVLIGPYDLSAALGVPGAFTHPAFLSAVQRVATACADARVPLGVFGMTPAALTPYVQLGATLLVAGTDAVVLGRGMESMLDALRGL